jgi:DNA-binding NarL/FixJ family response regulator
MAEPGRPVVCAGAVDDAGAATRALLAALAGHGLLVHAVAARDVLDPLYEDLQHIGPLVVRGHDDAAAHHSRAALSPEQQDLVRLLLTGSTLAAAAARLSISRRTADRRVAAARRLYGAATTAQLLRAAGADLD